mmetsp:Transcript_15953/g.26867  ORF Transcript_15953/g.26867 Transcript_15953/m.26867 type:complete len:462 (+) Transcript_15953:60-1445(+)
MLIRKDRSIPKVFFFFIIVLILNPQTFVSVASMSSSSSRVTTTIPLPTAAIGTEHSLIIHHFKPQLGDDAGNDGTGKAYIQSSLHADELPGLLVARQLIKLLEEASLQGRIAKDIVIVPYANPIGLSQNLLNSHLGRFNLATGTNFNRGFDDVTDAVAKRVKDKLRPSDGTKNTQLIREAMLQELGCQSVNEADFDNSMAPSPVEPISLEKSLKQLLLRTACDADIVLDLHCDSDALLHMYTHDRLWPDLADLCAFLGSECQILDADSGGGCFDESCSGPWAKLAELFPKFPIPMACQSTTVELRGQSEVNTTTAAADAQALFAFLQYRGFIRALPPAPVTATTTAATTATTTLPAAAIPSPPPLKREATPLTGVDMIKAPHAGVLSWLVNVGEEVGEGQILGHVVNITDPFADPTPLLSRTTGVVYGRLAHHLAIPGLIVIKVAGKKPLPWRTGYLLTSR